VRKAGNRLRITGQLIEAQSGNHIWAERYDGDVEDVFDLQDEITSSVVAMIEPTIRLAEIKRAQARATTNLSAYDLMLRATAMYRDFRPDGLRQACALLEQAVSLDPEFSSAHGLLANCCWLLILGGYAPVDETRARGRLAAQRAVETGRDDPDALARGGLGIAYFTRHMDEGLAHVDRALALNPSSLLAWRYGGWTLAMAGRHEKAIEYFDRAMKLAPMGPDVYDLYVGIAQPLFFLGRHEEALAWSNKALRERPRLLTALRMKLMATAMLDRPAEEVADARRQLLDLIPEETVSSIRKTVAFWGDNELLILALHKAGLPE
jgi:adenylate cyclase